MSIPLFSRLIGLIGERGTWTPSISANNTEATPTYQAGLRGGWYVKVGPLLVYWFQVGWTAIGSPTGQARILGLPFEPAVDGLQSGAIRAVGFTSYAGKTIMGSYKLGPQLLLATSEGTDINAANLPASGSLVGFGATIVA